MFNGNKIYKIDKNGKKKRIFGFIPGLNIRFKGNNSTIILHEPFPKFKNCRFKLQNNSTIEIKSSKDFIKKLEIIMLSDQTCKIGENFFTFGCEIIFAYNPNLKVEIGDNCMFAKNILIRPSDGHSIIDINSKELLNPDMDIKIGNDVWIAGNATILKGAEIANNSIIGHGSVVTKKCDIPYLLVARQSS